MIIVNVFKSLFITIFFSIFLFIFATLVSRAGDIFQLQEIKTQYKIFTNARTPLVNGKPDNELSLEVNTNLFDYFYYNNVIHAITSDNSYKLVGLNRKLGFRMTEWLDIQYSHHSQHNIDGVWPFKYPLEDSFGVNIYLYSKKNRNSFLW